MILITNTLPTKGKCIMYQYLIFLFNLPTKNSSMFFVSISNPKGVLKSLDTSPCFRHLHLHRAHHGDLGCLYAFPYPRPLSQFNSKPHATRNSFKSSITFFTSSSLSLSVICILRDDLLNFFLHKFYSLDCTLPSSLLHHHMGLIFGMNSKIEMRILCLEDLDAKLDFWFHLCVKLKKQNFVKKKHYKQGLVTH